MARKIKPATLVDVDSVDHAIVLLRDARRALVEAGATTAAKAVARALKSAEGAHRHTWHRYHRTKEAQS